MTRLNYLLLFTLSFLFLNCGGPAEEVRNEVVEESLYGGVFKMPIGSYFTCIKPVEIQKLETAQVYDQIVESLIKYNPKTMEIEPAIAESWSVSEDGLTYTFKIRDEVYFHDNACFEGGTGRILTLEDLKYTFETIYTEETENRAYYTFKNTIVGGEDFYEGKTDEISGITINGSEFSIEIAEPSASFIQKIATIFTAVVPKEALDAENFIPVGTGPFAYDETNSNSELITLTRNAKYYMVDEEGNSLPYLNSVVFEYYEHSEDQMDLFWEGGMTYIPGVPITSISEVLEERIGDFEGKTPKYILISEPQLSTTYLEFNMNTPVLRNKKVRQAINYAINRKKLVEKILKNQAYEIGKFGITPPLPKIFKDYDFEGIEDVSYVYNPELAKKLLAEAGYPEGKNFPSIEMQFRLGNDHYLVASEIQSQLRSVLNINVDIEAIEFNKLIENQGFGKADVFRSTWFSDYPSPETFLVNAYGKVVPKDINEPSYINSSRFQNKEFDKFFEAGGQSGSVEEAYAAFAEAEKILMEQAPFIILWYGEDMMLLQSNVQQFETNVMRYLDLRNVFIQDIKVPEDEIASGNH